MGGVSLIYQIYGIVRSHVLRLQNIRKSFGSTIAVDGLSLSVPKGTIFGLLGPNGAGKTTTTSLCVGLLHPDSGSLEIAGVGPPTDPAVRRHIGVAPQSVALYDDLSALENLRFFAKLYGMERTQAAKRAGEVLELVGLSGRSNDRVGAYSGGMKRRLNLAAAVLHEPALVFMDEPTAGVDPQSRTTILDIAQRLRNNGTTVVYTTHYMEEAQRLCDLVAIMDHGRLLAEDSVDGLINRFGGQTMVTVHTTAGPQRVATTDPVTELQQRLKQPDVLNVRVDRPDLESVFLSLTGRSLRDA